MNVRAKSSAITPKETANILGVVASNKLGMVKHDDEYAAVMRDAATLEHRLRAWLKE